MNLNENKYDSIIANQIFLLIISKHKPLFKLDDLLYEGNLSEEYKSFTPRLLAEVPEFKSWVMEIDRNDDGTYINYGVMSTFVRYMRDISASIHLNSDKYRDPQEILQRCLAFIDLEIATADPDVVNLIRIELYENLDQSPDPNDDLIKQYMGPFTRKDRNR